MIRSKDIEAIRALAETVAEIGASERQSKLRKMWKDHNSFKHTGLPIHVWVSMCADELIAEKDLVCESEVLRRYEKELRLTIFQDEIKDDTVIEPFLIMRAKHVPDINHRYGIPMITGRETDTSKYHFTPPVQSLEDIDKLTMPAHKIDWAATNAEAELLEEAIGGVLPVAIDSAPMFVGIEGDVSTDMGFLLGFENILFYLYDEPELLHKLAETLANAVIKQHEEAERAGDWKTVSGCNQCITYANELPEPSASGKSVSQKEVWGFLASQEFTTVSPEMYYEFLFKYQIPIMERFGLSSYGCCEDLTRKIDMLKQVKNLRRISVSPWARLPACAETIGKDYVISWRPNPAEMITSDLNERHITQTMQDACDVFKRNGSIADITLKDVKTVFHKPQNMKKWVEIVRKACENRI